MMSRNARDRSGSFILGIILCKHIQRTADPQAYSTHIDNIMNALAKDHALGREIDTATVACGLEPARPENRKIRDFAKKTLKISPADFDRALEREAVKAEFGRYPSDATEFVAIMAEKKRITARY